MAAAAARKLQKEIENVLKKVEDGLQEFAEFWEQAISTSSNQQRERHGEELKKSINKLQRLRVQIREWLTHSALQNNCKDKLEDARRRVENDMQRFKDFERDLKTKAFSTCALSKGEDDIDLEHAEKAKYQDWLVQTIQTLNCQLDQFEADLELLGAKRSLSTEDQSRETQLKTLQERHRWHVNKLELVLRAVDNDAIDMSDLAIVRDCIDFYVESHMEADCYHDETVYDCFDLTEFEEKVIAPPSPTATSPADNVSKEESAKKGKEREKRKKDDKKDKKKDDRREEKKDKKKEDKANAGGQQGAQNSSKSAQSANNAKQQAQFFSDDAQLNSREKAELEEAKVQEDQLLSEASEFICKICQIHVAGCGPKLTSCSHLFCGDCIQQWFNQHPECQTWAQRARIAGPDRVVPCPVCKTKLNEKQDLYPVCGVACRSENLLLWRMLSSLKIMCANHPRVLPEGKCEWVGEYGSYQKHILQCKNEPLPVENGNGPAVVGDTAVPRRPSTLSVDSESEVGSSTVLSRQVSCKSGSVAPTTPQQTQSLNGSMAPNTNQQASWTSPVVSPTLAPNRNAPSMAPQTQEVASHSGTPKERAKPVVDNKSRSKAPEAQEVDNSFIFEAANSFEQTDPITISVKVGDRIQVCEQHATGWTYAKNLSASPNECGWIPSWLAREAPAAQTAPAPIPAPVPAPAPAPSPASETTSPAVTSAPRHQQSTKQNHPVVRVCATFAAASPQQLTLTLSDRVEIIERDISGWTFGRKVADCRSEQGTSEGWFPDWAVAQK